MSDKNYLKNKSGTLIISAYVPRNVYTLVINCLFLPRSKRKYVNATTWVKLIEIEKRSPSRVCKPLIKEYVHSLIGSTKKIKRIDIQYIGRKKFVLDYNRDHIVITFPKTKEN